MNTRLFLCALSLLSLVSTACGGDAKSPKIRSFTSTPATLPTAGGETTLTWDVSNADSLELLPNVGAVSGSALTLNVTETTEFTLVAKKNGRVARKKTTVTCAAPATVQGIVRFTTTRQPLADVAVFLNGQATVTDSSGRFYFEDVATPYEVMIYLTVDPVVFIYQGLTRLDPILEFPIAPSGDPIQVDGTVTPTTAAADTFTMVSMKGTSEVFPSQTTADNGTGAYTANPNFFCLYDCATEKTTAVATRYTWPGTGLATFSHLGRTTRDINADDGDVTGFDIAMSPVANAVTTGTYLLDPWEDYNPLARTMILDSATGAASDVGFMLPSESFSITTANAFSVSSPDVAGELQIWSSFTDLNTGSEGVHVERLSPGETDVDIELPVLPRLLTPVENGTVSPTSLFQMTGSTSSVKMFGFQASSVFLMTIFTTADSITLPDLSPLGIRFQDGEELLWNAMEISPAPSVDAVAGPEGLFGAQPEVFGFTETRSAFYDDGSFVMLP